MSGILTHFRIEGLHGRYTVNVDIQDNKLILVGENGTGKSTVVNIIYLFLTQQWHRIPSQYDFKSIAITIDSEQLEVTKEELLHTRNVERLLRRVPLGTRRRLNIMLSEVSLETLISSREKVIDYSIRYEVPSSFIREYIDQVLEESSFDPEKIEKVNSVLKSLTEKILYLPTYRRIEQDLAAILPGWEQSPELKRAIEQSQHRGRSSGYVELVEFGMKDVEETISYKMRELKDGLGADLSKLTSTYLRDVILGVYQSAEPSEISELDESTLNTVFSRIDQTVLPEREQHLLRTTIEEIKTRHDFHDKDKVVVHFLTKLIDLHKNQQQKERDVLEFVNVCNQYLSGKKFIYDNINSTMTIRLQKSQLHNNMSDQETSDGKTDLLEMSKLSSGEKQIVSLFAQIYLSGSSNYFVIIDEPELSLSVFWQKRFLPDILSTGRCKGLIAVTHSPYIFDNELDEYTKSLENFMEPFDVTG